MLEDAGLYYVGHQNHHAKKKGTSEKASMPVDNLIPVLIRLP